MPTGRLLSTNEMLPGSCALMSEHARCLLPARPPAHPPTHPCAPALPPLDEGLDQGGVALGRRQVQEGHPAESLRVDQVLGLGPAGPAHHLLAHDHHAALEAAPQRPGAGRALERESAGGVRAPGPHPGGVLTQGGQRLCD